MRVLVTGGAGYIGSHTAKVLAGAGYVPVVFDNLSSGHRWAVQWGPLVEGDLADVGLIRRTLVQYNIEAVIHFAASAYVGESMAVPEKYFRNNVINTLNLLEAMLAVGVGNFIFSSSCATFGIPGRTPVPDDHPQRPVNPYGESKLFIEQVLGWYGKAHGFKSVALRYFNAAGADPEGNLGEDHSPETHLVPLAIGAALGRFPYLEVYGTDYDTPDGTAIRDYVHVMDLAEAHVLALRHLLDGCSDSAFNLGVGRGYSVREVVAAVANLVHARVPVRERPRRPGDPPVLVAESTRATEVLGWRPRYPQLDTIVASALSWHAARRARHAVVG